MKTSYVVLLGRDKRTHARDEKKPNSDVLVDRMEEERKEVKENTKGLAHEQGTETEQESIKADEEETFPERGKDIVEVNTETRVDSKKDKFSPSRFSILSNTSDEEVKDKEEGEIAADSQNAFGEEVASSSSEKEARLKLEKTKEDPSLKKKPSSKKPQVNRQNQKITQQTKQKQEVLLMGELIIMTSFFAWNTRGFNEMHKQDTVRSWLHSAKPSFGYLLEIRVQEVNSSAIIDRVF
ncbi:unnamed protein product [Arabis nemorensis]|uniref:Uncharacterized protein n=1 Tax=Arabis nemorensis TaxID=586526 RepID=A0A565CBD8_9BRAS|nr:unnamed protein product [Arabis nemorensis]